MTKGPAVKVCYNCPSCESTQILEIDRGTRFLDCPHCACRVATPDEAIEKGVVHKCLACGSGELFLRKDFPQRLGVGIVVLGVIFSSIAWYDHRVLMTYGILFLTALLDLVLFVTMGTVLECYRCHAQYRGSREDGEYDPFDLEVHERHRQEAIRSKNVG